MWGGPPKGRSPGQRRESIKTTASLLVPDQAEVQEDEQVL